MKKSRFVFGAIFALLIVIFTSGCYAPSPFYGTWADNSGDTITFMSDMSYNAKIYINNTVTSQTGSYEVLMNVLILRGENGNVMESEWDIRGNILYMEWSDGSKNKKLKLFKIAN